MTPVPPTGFSPCYLFRVEEDHLGWPEFTERFDGSDGRRTLINFHSRWTKQVHDLPDGTRFLVWVRQTQRFWADMALDGSFAEAKEACRAHGFEPDGSRHGPKWGRYYRPVKFLARVPDPARGPTMAEISRRSGVPLRPFQPTKQHLTPAEYGKLIAAIDWA